MRSKRESPFKKQTNAPKPTPTPTPTPFKPQAKPEWQNAPRTEFEYQNEPPPYKPTKFPKKQTANTSSTFYFDNGTRLNVNDDDVDTDTYQLFKPVYRPYEPLVYQNTFTGILDHTSSSASRGSSARSSSNNSSRSNSSTSSGDEYMDVNDSGQSFIVQVPGKTSGGKTSGRTSKYNRVNSNDYARAHFERTLSNKSEVQRGDELARYNIEAHRQHMKNQDDNEKMYLYNTYDERRMRFANEQLKSDDLRNQRKHEYDVERLRNDGVLSQNRMEIEDRENERLHRQQLSHIKYNTELGHSKYLLDDRQGDRDLDFNKYSLDTNHKNKAISQYYSDRRNQREHEQNIAELDYIIPKTNAQLALNQQKHDHAKENTAARLALNQQKHDHKIEMKMYNTYEPIKRPHNRDEKDEVIEYVAELAQYNFNQNINNYFASNPIKEGYIDQYYQFTLFFAGVSYYEYDGKGNVTIKFHQKQPMTLRYNNMYYISDITSRNHPGILVLRMKRNPYYEPTIIDRLCPRLKDCNIY